MINLIPPEGHKMARREYISRVGSTIALLFSAVAFCLTAAMIPTYLLVSAQTSALETEMREHNISTTALSDAEKEVKRIQKVTTQLKNASSTQLATKLVAEIERLAPPTIIFKNMSIESGKGSVGKMQVQGIAPTREVLAALKNALESSDLFLKAEIPIADLARDKNIPFSLSITVAKPK